MQELRYLVIEYIPLMMDGNDLTPAKIDGHYLLKEDAIEIARFWSDKPMHEQSRIVVAKVVFEEKNPVNWGGKK